MNNLGWIKLERNILDHWSWNGAPFSEGQAIVDLLLKANHKQGKKVRIRGGFISLQPGQLLCSENGIAKDWMWSRGKVRRFLSLLEEDGLIVQQKDNRATVITLCKYGTNSIRPNHSDHVEQYSEQDNEKNNEQDSPRTEIVQQQGNSQYKRKPTDNKGFKQSSILDLEKVDTANGTTFLIQEVKKEEKERKKKGKGKMVVAEPVHFLSSAPECFLPETWELLLSHLREKQSLDQNRLSSIVLEIEKATAFYFSPADCVDCMVSHGWRDFEALWLKTSAFYRKKMKVRANEQSVVELKRTEDLLKTYDDTESKQSHKEWLHDESYLLMIERKITPEQRQGIMNGKIKIDPFLHSPEVLGNASVN